MSRVETGFGVKTPLWNNLGTCVKEAPTSKDALRLAGLDWKVEPKPIFNEVSFLIITRLSRTKKHLSSLMNCLDMV